MLKIMGKHRWMGILLLALVGGAYGGPATSQVSSRKLNPYHEQQLRDQIQKCASGVMACTDMEMRSLKQQELCQLLIRAERYDEALQVAHNIYKTDNVDKERRAAHHFLMAEIYNRKMQASNTLTEMDRNRQFALSAAQEVVEHDYPSGWQVSERARALIRQLSDTSSMGQVRRRVSSREGTGDTAKEAIAEAQRKYLDATLGGVQQSAGNAQPASQFVRVAPDAGRNAADVSRAKSAAEVPADGSDNLPASPSVRRVVSPTRYESGTTIQASDRLNRSGLLTSQGGISATSPGARQPILVNGTAVTASSSVDSVVQNNLAQLLEAARKRKENSRSPYATGELPTSMR